MNEMRPQRTDALMQKKSIQDKNIILEDGYLYQYR